MPAKPRIIKAGLARSTQGGRYVSVLPLRGADRHPPLLLSRLPASISGPVRVQSPVCHAELVEASPTTRATPQTNPPTPRIWVRFAETYRGATLPQGALRGWDRAPPSSLCFRPSGFPLCALRLPSFPYLSAIALATADVKELRRLYPSHHTLSSKIINLR
jgi:hypothetical protein